MRLEKQIKVDSWNNFCRVFELPDKFSSEFCFGGGINTNFKMVDWFHPIPNLEVAGCTKEVYQKKVGEIPHVMIYLSEEEEKLIPWIKSKVYIKQNKKYIIIYRFGQITLFDTIES